MLNLAPAPTTFRGGDRGYSIWQICASVYSIVLFYLKNSKRKGIHVIELPLRRSIFRTKQGSISAMVREIHPSVCILESVIRGPDSIAPGSFLARNFNLGRRSKGSIEWMVFPDIYTYMRGTVSALRNGGAQPDVTDGDLQELVANPQTLRQCAGFVFSEATESEYMNRASQIGIDFVIETNKHRQNEPLTFAYLDTLRGVQLADSKGRRNPAAAAMALGGAIHRMHVRDVDLRLIMSRLNIRVFRTASVIYSTIDMYESLLASIGGRDPRTFSKDAVLMHVANHETYHKAEARLATLVLEEHIANFGRVVALPYLQNARHMQSDLIGMRPHLQVLSKHWDTESAEMMRRFLKVLRQGILWFLAHHRLEIEILAPLSWALTDVARRAKIVRKAVHGAMNEEFDIEEEADKIKFSAILQRMYSYRRLLERCSDTVLKQRIKGVVIGYVTDAIQFAEQGDWRETKASLKHAASFL